VDIANQTLGIKVVEVGGSNDTARFVFRRNKQEDARFPGATKAPTTKLLDYLLPQIGVYPNAGPAGPKL